jgi:hypothetical protein
MVVMLAGLATAGGLLGTRPRVGGSACAFQRYFEGLKRPEASVNPLERFVYSLMLANTKQKDPRGTT